MNFLHPDQHLIELADQRFAEAVNGARMTVRPCAELGGTLIQFKFRLGSKDYGYRVSIGWHDIDRRPDEWDHVIDRMYADVRRSFRYFYSTVSRRN